MVITNIFLFKVIKAVVYGKSCLLPFLTDLCFCIPQVDEIFTLCKTVAGIFVFTLNWIIETSKRTIHHATGDLHSSSPKTCQMEGFIPSVTSLIVFLRFHRFSFIVYSSHVQIQLIQRFKMIILEFLLAFFGLLLSYGSSDGFTIL